MQCVQATIKELSHVCVLSRVHQDRQGHQGVRIEDCDEHEGGVEGGGAVTSISSHRVNDFWGGEGHLTSPLAIHSLPFPCQQSRAGSGKRVLSPRDNGYEYRNKIYHAY